MRDPVDLDDPKGLVRESYRIEGISEGECRSILVDWALSLPVGADTSAVAARLAERPGIEGHPMTALLRAATALAPAGRRGGRAARVAAGRGDETP